MASRPELKLETRPTDGSMPRPLQSVAPIMPSWLTEREPREPHRPRLQFRTVWISDLHLGTPGRNAELLLDFLKSIACDTLYLVGDIIDGWQLKKG